MQSIAATTTGNGLTVYAELDTGEYPTGIKIPDHQMKALETSGALARHDWHGEWNYTLTPTHPTNQPESPNGANLTTGAGSLLHQPGRPYPGSMRSAVRKSMSYLGLGLVLVTYAACNGSIVTTPAPQRTKYNQTWTKSYGLTICKDWNDEMTTSQQWVAAADMLTGARNKRDGGNGLPPDSLITRFQGAITEACSVDESQQLPEIAVGVYLDRP